MRPLRLTLGSERTRSLVAYMFSAGFVVSILAFAAVSVVRGWRVLRVVVWKDGLAGRRKAASRSRRTFGGLLVPFGEAFRCFRGFGHVAEPRVQVLLPGECRSRQNGLQVSADELSQFPRSFQNFSGAYLISTRATAVEPPTRTLQAQAGDQFYRRPN